MANLHPFAMSNQITPDSGTPSVSPAPLSSGGLYLIVKDTGIGIPADRSPA